MPEAVEILAKLLKDAELRLRLRTDPESLQHLLELAPDQLAFVRTLDPGQLEQQAIGLLQKRAFEVGELLPQTAAFLGPDFFDTFCVYARSAAWPEGHRRHQQDAAAFSHYLRSSGSSAWQRSEDSWIRFCTEGSRLQICVFFERTGSLRRTPGFQICLRTRRRNPFRVKWSLPLPF